MLPSAILFDLDNTLVHRGESIEAYSRSFFAEYQDSLEPHCAQDIYAVVMRQDNGGYLPPCSPFASISESVASGLFSTLRWRDRPSLAALRAHWMAHDVEHTVEMPGASALIAQIATLGLPMGVISNGKHASRVGRVSKLAFGKHMRLVLSSENAGVKKPDARIFHLAAAQLGVQPKDCWYIGDHPLNDVEGAQRAGMRAVWLSGFHEWPLARPAPEFTVSSLTEVLPLLEQAFDQEPATEEKVRGLQA